MDFLKILRLIMGILSAAILLVDFILTKSMAAHFSSVAETFDSIWYSELPYLILMALTSLLCFFSRKLGLLISVILSFFLIKILIEALPHWKIVSALQNIYSLLALIFIMFSIFACFVVFRGGLK